MKQALERSEKILLQSLIIPSALFRVCTTCPCPMGYPKPSPRGHYRSKSGGMLTIIEYDQVDQKAGHTKD